MALVVSAALLLVWSAYFFHFATPRYVQGPLVQAVLHAWPASSRLFALPLPCPEYLEGLSYQLADSAGHPHYLRGNIGPGWYTYFLHAMAYKTPEPVLLLLAGALVMLLRRDDRYLLIRVALPACLFFMVMSLVRADKGLRYVLPCLPFWYLLCGRPLAWWHRRHPRTFTGLAVALVCWAWIGQYRIHPHYLAYFNDLSGGPAQGRYLLVDSNLDWGQDLPGLAAYLRSHDAGRVHLAYFGLASPDYYGIDWDHLGSAPVADGGLAAVSVTYRQGLYLSDPSTYDWLENCPIVASIGHSILVYRLPRRPPP